MRFVKNVTKNKLVLLAFVLAFLCVGAGAYYLIVIRNKDAKTDQQEQTATQLFNVINESNKPVADSIAAESYTYTKENSLKSLETLRMLVLGNKFEGVEKALQSIPDTEPTPVIKEKYELCMRMHIQLKNQAAYTVCRDNLKKVLTSRTDELAKSTLADFDTLYLVEAAYKTRSDAEEGM